MSLKSLEEPTSVYFSKRWAWGALFIAMGILLAAGLFSHGVSLGDEVHHYRFAKSSYWLNGRAAFDVIFTSGDPPGFYYASDPLWSLILVVIWKGIGHISFTAAQIYQTLYYGLLLVCTYLSAKKIYGNTEAWWSLFLVATVPMIVSFSVLFYVDVPATALAMLCFLLLLEKRYFWFSIIFGAQFLMKRNTLFFAPAFFGMLLYDQRQHKAKALGYSVLSILPLLIITVWDSAWRSRHFPLGFSMLFQTVSRIPLLAPLRKLFFSSEKISTSLPPMLERHGTLFLAQFSNSSIFSLKDNGMYFGVLLAAGFAVYLFNRKEKKDLRILMFLLTFLAINFGLSIIPDIRYVLPVVPFLAILAAKGMSRVCRNRLIAGLVILLGLGQLGAAAGYTALQRKISPEIQQGFAYVRQNFPKGAVAIYPEVNFVEYAERPMIWGNLDLPIFLAGTPEERVQVLLSSHVDYLIVKKSRIYDDAQMPLKHYGGYPKSLVDWLPESGILENVFENSGMTIWKIKQPAEKGGVQ